MSALQEGAQTRQSLPTDDTTGKGQRRSTAKTIAFSAALALLVGVLGYQVYETRRLSREVASLTTQLDASGPDVPDLQTNARQLPPPRLDNWPFWGTELDLDHWDPRAELQRMQQEMNQLFGTSFSRFHVSPRFGSLFESRAFSPSIDVEETADAYLVRVDVPRVSEATINVEVQDNLLHIQGETNRETERSESKGQIVRKERFEGRFKRSVPLPSDVDAAKVTSEYENGILTIRLPKTVSPGD